uniref:5'-nucleotidase domain-containing protein 1 n=2 Tax=Hirondellea gigas TaxID=1518452 RepID=A0A6A7G3R3_9CRUS
MLACSYKLESPVQSTPDKMVVKVDTIEQDDLMTNKIFKKKYYCKNNKKKKQPPFPSADIFRFSDYDYVGFDLDNTICRYKVAEIMRLEYKLIAEYLVNKYGYDTSLLLGVDDDMDFLQKGIIMDIKRGNFLKCSKDGVILRATHGTRPMTRAEIIEVYGKDKTWEPILFFKETMYDNSPECNRLLRSFKDYFDMPAAIACARAIDIDDRSPNGPPEEYDIWQDVHVALCNMYRREYYSTEQGGFFPELKENPGKYMYEASDRLKKWLMNLKEHTYTFLVSGSSIDYASHTAEFVLGEDWRDYFDTVVCTAKKPHFFTAARPFRYLNGHLDAEEVPLGDLRINGTYSGGNWAELLELVKIETGIDNPHCLYVGDHLCQDVLTPPMVGIDTIAIVEELAAEGMCGDPLEHDAGSDLMSMFWGSFFTTDGNNKVMGIDRINTLYGDIPIRSARLAIPCLEVVARNGIKFQYDGFSSESSGFYPGDPVILHF